MNSDYVRERNIGKTSDSIDLYTKLELWELTIVIVLILIASYYTYYLTNLTGCLCEANPMSAYLISNLGIINADLIDILIMIVLFLIIVWSEKTLDVKYLGIFIFLVLIGIHAFDVYHDYTVFLVGGY